MTEKKYAEVAWTANDVKTLRPNWTLDECREFLANNQRRIQDRTIEHGWDVIEILLQMDKE